MVVAVCRHCCGEACLVIWVAVAAAGDRVVAGAEADLVVADSVAAVVLEEVSVAVVILVEVDRAEAGNQSEYVLSVVKLWLRQ